MIVESEDLFSEDIPRDIALVRRISNYDGGTIWDVVLDNVNTGAAFSQNAIDAIKTSSDTQVLLDKLIQLTKDKLGYYHYTLSNEESKELQKIVRALL